MLWLRKSKKGFTLIELMVVVVIIAVLAVIGLRVYSGQVEKAKNAVIKANVGTIQTLIQAELADRPVTDLDSPTGLSAIIFANAGIYNPVTRLAQTACPENETAAAAGEVWVTHIAASGPVAAFWAINGVNATDSGNVFDDPLRATR